MIHESCYVDEPCEIGAGTRIWHFSHLMRGCRIGRECSIGQNCVISPGVVIGDRCKIQNNVSVYTGVELEEGVFLGPSMVFTNVLTPRAHIPRNTPADFQPTHVRRGASIGANATIVAGLTIGQYALIGAGAVVTRDVPDFAIVYGNRARAHGWACHCGAALRFAGYPLPGFLHENAKERKRERDRQEETRRCRPSLFSLAAGFRAFALSRFRAKRPVLNACLVAQCSACGSRYALREGGGAQRGAGPRVAMEEMVMPVMR